MLLENKSSVECLRRRIDCVFVFVLLDYLRAHVSSGLTVTVTFARRGRVILCVPSVSVLRSSQDGRRLILCVQSVSVLRSSQDGQEARPVADHM